jgi:4'-phosphopantetheinyl transferase EntD
VVIEQILPPEVASAEAFHDPPEAVLFPAEEEMINRAVDKRRREFRTTRHCARRALSQLGLPLVPLLRGEHGQPQWPAGVVGSMTHCVGYRAAAVARSCEIPALGIDAEPHAPLPAEVLQTIAVPEEHQALIALARSAPQTCWDRVLFCAKEAVYKAWFPLTRRWLGFADVTITIEPTDRDQGRFQVRLGTPDPAVTAAGTFNRLAGHWLRGADLVITTAVLSARR